MDIVRTENLCKRYGPRPVLHEIELRIPRGSLYGFLGPNGAGKTTTLRILLGLLRPTTGVATLFGRDAWRCGPTIRRDVGYLPGDVRFYGHLSGRALLHFFARARRMTRLDLIDALARRFDLDLDKRIRHYSRGMKQKLGLIQAFMHRPQLLILDEPTMSLDPLVQQTLYELLREVVADGRTVLFSSHTLSEVEALCDYVAIVRGGRLVEQDRIETLQQRAVRHVEVRFRERRVPALPEGLHVRAQQSGLVTGSWTGPIEPLLHWLAGANVADVEIGRPGLEDLFLAYYDEAETGAAP